jgi:hypothetical protein
MASKSERKFVTTLCFSMEIARCIKKQYEGEPGKAWIKGKVEELKNLSGKYLQKYNGNIGHKDIALIKQHMEDMSENGLEQADSYQTYLAFQMGLLSDREAELAAHNGSKEKIGVLQDLQKRVDQIWVYFASRTRNEKLDVDGMKLMDQFNRVFS